MSKVQEKITELTQKLENLVKQHNELVSAREQAYSEILGVQGALKALNDVNVDTDTDSEGT